MIPTEPRELKALQPNDLSDHAYYHVEFPLVKDNASDKVLQSPKCLKMKGSQLRYHVNKLITSKNKAPYDRFSGGWRVRLWTDADDAVVAALNPYAPKGNPPMPAAAHNAPSELAQMVKELQEKIEAQQKEIEALSAAGIVFGKGGKK